LKRWRLPLNIRRGQCVPLSDRFIFDEANFTLDPRYLGSQIGWQNAGWVWIVRGRRRIRLIRQQRVNDHRAPPVPRHTLV
jgi:hypothetical protein